LNAPNSNIKKDLKRLEEEQIFSELDFKITDKEILIIFLLNKKFSNLVLSILANSFPNALPIVIPL
jgi:hypothetical protein